MRRKQSRIRRLTKSNRQSSQNSQPLDADILAEKENKIRKLTLPERRGTLSNFWYRLVNEPSCLRAPFLDHFDEPQEFRVHIRKDRCCSDCTTCTMSAVTASMPNCHVGSHHRGNRNHSRHLHTYSCSYSIRTHRCILRTVAILL